MIHRLGNIPILSHNDIPWQNASYSLIVVKTENELTIQAVIKIENKN